MVAVILSIGHDKQRFVCEKVRAIQVIIEKTTKTTVGKSTLVLLTQTRRSEFDRRRLSPQPHFGPLNCLYPISSSYLLFNWRRGIKKKRATLEGLLEADKRNRRTKWSVNRTLNQL